MERPQQISNQNQKSDDGSTQIPAPPVFSYAAMPVLVTQSLRPPIYVPKIRNPQTPRHAEIFNNLQQKPGGGLSTLAPKPQQNEHQESSVPMKPKPEPEPMQEVDDEDL
ncbi:hypothetical protein DCAR_0310894 [Daucus carota subsp. sativus]|uniref:Uncharacterized protein n=1 Tax=Daucus carota subsp. sativus TaxID=79200 RepID=A0A166A970_DAUCS|nr:hypothetical protein DCAR_0310894 [Daucus carota subsp. sativus]